VEITSRRAHDKSFDWHRMLLLLNTALRTMSKEALLWVCVSSFLLSVMFYTVL
jgi:hypothetical protein